MPTLLDVADNLAASARTRHGDEADAFGRSAFNRYYYATYLTTRDLLGQIDRGWKKTNHGNIPTVLEKDLFNRIKETVRKLESSGLLSRGHGQSLVSQAGSASGEIASILRTAYKVRVTADYEPEQLVIFNPSEFKLATHTDAEARNWTSRVERLKGVLIKVSKEVGLV